MKGARPAAPIAGLKVWGLALLLGVAALSPPSPHLARAQTAPESALLEADVVAFEELLNDRISQLSALESALAETDEALGAQLAERDRLDAEIVALSAEQGRLDEEIAALRTQQQAASARIESLQGELVGLERQLQELLVSLHKRRSGRYARLLAESESLFELRVRNYYLSQLTRQDVVLLETLAETAAAVDAAQTERSQRLGALSQREAELAANQSALAAAQGDLSRVIAALESTQAGQLAQQQALLNEQSSIEADLVGARSALAEELERQRVLAERRAEAQRRRAEEAERTAAAARQQNPPDAASDIGTDIGTGEADSLTDGPEDNAFEADAQRLEELIRALSSPAPAPQTDADFVPPFPNPVVVRPYGEGGGSDIWLQAEAPGTAVQAVKAGVVYQASRITANSGYTVAVQHESDLISAYTNLQPPEVALGDQVQQGQVLGYLGGGIISPDVLQFRLGTQSGLQIIYQDPAAPLGIAEPNP